MAEIRVGLDAACHRFCKTLVVGRHRCHLNLLPGRRLGILAEATAQFRSGRSVDDLEAALFAIDAQLQLIQMAGCPAAGVDDAEGAIGKIDRHGEAVIGIEHIFADLAARRLLKVFSRAKTWSMSVAAP